jgi:purine-binding chemotaxis protein CheW
MYTNFVGSAVHAPNASCTAAIDWQVVQQKMGQLQALTQQETTFTAEEKLAVLKTRAQRLARPLEEAAAASLQLEVIEFYLGAEPYALPSTSVREVYPLKGLTPLPCTPPFVLGVMNVRGRILPVVDLTSLLGLTKQRLSEQSTVILMRAGELEVGVVTDLVIGVRSLPLITLHPPLSTLANSRAHYLRGITSEGLVVIDATKLLGSIRLGSDE